MIGMHRHFLVERLGHRGEGVVPGPVYVPYALPGDAITADVEGERGRLVAIRTPSADRVAPFCPHFTVCGGCAVQALAPEPYAAWKRDIIVTALADAGVASETGVTPLVDAHGEGRRRATFHARGERKGLRLVSHVGFMQARAHAIVDIDHCPVLAPAMAGALPAARAVAKVLLDLDKPLDIVVTATGSGLDLDIRGCGPLRRDHTGALFAIAERLDLARIANHGVIVVEHRQPVLAMGNATVVPPPGAFLQATQAGEDTLAALVRDGLAGARHIADLFAGIGTFALRLAEAADVVAVDSDRAAIAALAKARRSGAHIHPLSGDVRDLMRRPLSRAECDAYDAVVFDPPRAGAPLQAAELAVSNVPAVAAVSCNAATFARDARTLVGGGYRLQTVTSVDQFRHSPHVEIVGIFRRRKPTRRPRRALLG